MAQIQEIMAQLWFVAFQEDAEDQGCSKEDHEMEFFCDHEQGEPVNSHEKIDPVMMDIVKSWEKAVSKVSLFPNPEYVPAPYECSWLTSFRPPPKRGPRKKWLKARRRSWEAFCENPNPPLPPSGSVDVPVVIRCWNGKWKVL